MRILITGITGMVGSHLAEFVFNNYPDVEIHGITRWRSPIDNIRRVIEHVTLHHADLHDLYSLMVVMEKVRPDRIFHLAAQSYVMDSFDIPADTLAVNIIGTANVLDSIRKTGLDPLIHICSSSEVFGRVSKDQLPIDEECLFHPASPYAISKVGTDLVGRFYAEAYGLKTISSRMFTHTGPRRGDVFAESSFAKQISMIEKGLIPPVVKTGNLDSLRTFSDVRDAVRAYHMMLTVNPIPGEYYNIGGTHVCKIGKMLDTLLSMSTVKEIEIEVDKERLRPIDADLQVPDITKFSKHTGWKPQISFEKTMKDLLEYWRDQINKKQFLQR